MTNLFVLFAQFIAQNIQVVSHSIANVVHETGGLVRIRRAVRVEPLAGLGLRVVDAFLKVQQNSARIVIRMMLRLQRHFVPLNHLVF